MKALETEPIWGATGDDWQRLIEHGLLHDLLPVVSNPQAVLSPQSDIKEVGKVPSEYNRAALVRGIKGWTGIRASAKQIKAWSAQPDYGICVQTREVRAIDVDVTDAALAGEILATISAFFNDRGLQFSVRGRPNSAKFLVPFRMVGEYPKEKLACAGANQFIEFLANGQQFVCCATHPSGVRYTWDDGLRTPAHIPTLISADWLQLKEELELLYGAGAWGEGRLAAQDMPPTTEDDFTDDPVVQYVLSNGLDRGVHNGGLGVVCPWTDEHSSDSGPSEAVYWPRRPGNPMGGFRCLHGHCTGRTVIDLLEAWDIEIPRISAADEFGPDEDELLPDATGDRPAVVYQVAKVPPPESPEEALARMVRRIEEADAAELREKLMPAVKGDRGLAALDRDRLIVAVHTRFKALGQKVSVDAVRREMRPDKVDPTASADRGWLHGWAYNTQAEQWVHWPSRRIISRASFDLIHEQHVPLNEHGGPVKRASNWAVTDLGAPEVHGTIYDPSVPPDVDQVVRDTDGQLKVNIFRHSSRPETPDTLDEGGREAVGLVCAHLSKLMDGNPHKIDVLVSWLAWVVQNPGRRANWAPILIGPQGNGKSFISELLVQVLGHENVSIAQPGVVKRDFNAWVENVEVVFLEELLLEGERKYEVLNALKPLVTNRLVQIHAKGRDAYTARNTASFIGATNNTTPLPLDENERRFWIANTCLLGTPPGELEAALRDAGMTADYFDALFTAVRGHPGALRRWLLDLPIPAWFDGEGRAPASSDKAEMVQAAMDDSEATLRELLRTGGPGVTEWVVASYCLRVHLVDCRHPDGLIKRVLPSLGFVSLNKQVRWNDAPRRIWIKRGAPVEGDQGAWIRAQLDASAEKANKNEDLL